MAKAKEICKYGHNMSVTRKQSPTGTPYCSLCKSVNTMKYIKKNKLQAANSSWRHKLKRVYKMTEQEYTDMYISQDGNCPICKTHIEYRGFHTHIDHSHDTGEVRSILCHKCNTAIGLLKEDTNIMQNAIEYVQKHNGNNI